jgi:hypothetical protein
MIASGNPDARRLAMTHWAWCLIAIASLALSFTGLAQTRPTYVENGKVDRSILKAGRS